MDKEKEIEEMVDIISDWAKNCVLIGTRYEALAIADKYGVEVDNENCNL